MRPTFASSITAHEDCSCTTMVILLKRDRDNWTASVNDPVVVEVQVNDKMLYALARAVSRGVRSLEPHSSDRDTSLGRGTGGIWRRASIGEMVCARHRNMICFKYS